MHVIIQQRVSGSALPKAIQNISGVNKIKGVYVQIDNGEHTIGWCTAYMPVLLN